MIHKHYRSKQTFILWLLCLITSYAFSQEKQTYLNGKYTSKDGSIFEVFDSLNFNLTKKEKFLSTKLYKGQIYYAKSKITLNSFDSLTSPILSQRVEYIRDTDKSKDSITIDIISPIKNQITQNDYWYCDGFLMYVLIEEGSLTIKQKSKNFQFTFPRKVKGQFIDTFNISFIPNLLCHYKIQYNILWSDPITTFDENVNYIKVYYDDLTEDRFNYSRIKNEELKLKSKNSFFLMNERFVKLSEN